MTGCFFKGIIPKTDAGGLIVRDFHEGLLVKIHSSREIFFYGYFVMALDIIK